MEKKLIRKTNFCAIPTPAEALDIVTEFCNFANPHEYNEDLAEIIWWAISSELADNAPMERGNYIYLINQLRKVLPAIYVLYHGEAIEE